MANIKDKRDENIRLKNLNQSVNNFEPTYLI